MGWKTKFGMWKLRIKLKYLTRKMLKKNLRAIKCVFNIVDVIGIPKNKDDVENLRKAIDEYERIKTDIDKIVIINAKKYIEWFKEDDANAAN